MTGIQIYGKLGKVSSASPGPSRDGSVAEL